MSIIFLHTALLVVGAILLVVAGAFACKFIDEKKYFKAALVVIVWFGVFIGMLYYRTWIEDTYFPKKEYITNDGERYSDFNAAVDHNIELRKECSEN